MAITIDWATKVISVPKADLTLIQASPTEIRQLDINAFRLELKDIEDDTEGIPQLDTHQHNPPVTVGGVTLARVVEIINGYTVTFEDGQYAVNLVGANSNIGDVTNVNQVSVRSGNSAGLVDTTLQNRLDYGGVIWMDVDNGLPGTTYPTGTLASPVDNFADAMVLAGTFYAQQINVLPTVTQISVTDDITGIKVMSSTGTAHLNFEAGNVVTDAVFVGCHLTGTAVATRHWFAEKSVLGAGSVLTGAQGTFRECVLDDEVTLSGDSTFFQCASGVAGIGTAIVDAGSAATVQFRWYVGGLSVQNLGPGDTLSLDVLPGRVILEASCTGGSVKIRGLGEPIEDNSTGTTVDSDGFMVSDDATLLRKFHTNRLLTDPNTGLMTLYDDDDTTVLRSGAIWEDTGAVQAYRSRGVERRDQMS